MVYKVRKKSVSPKTQAPPFSNTLFISPRSAPKSCVFYPCNKKTNQFVVNQLVFFYRVIPWESVFRCYCFGFQVLEKRL